MPGFPDATIEDGTSAVLLLDTVNVCFPVPPRVKLTGEDVVPVAAETPAMDDTEGAGIAFSIPSASILP